MSTIKEYLDYAELAQASYINGLTAGMFQSSYNVGGENILKNEFIALQASNFATRYIVVATTSGYGVGTLSGLDAVIFKDTNDGRYVLSIRGTTLTSPADILVDIELGKGGSAYAQTSDLEAFYNNVLDDHPEIQTLDVTGHSLGGFLAQVFTAKHSSVVNHAYTYNAPGLGGVAAEFGVSSLPSTKITNLYSSMGPEIIAGLGTLIGNVIPISTDDASHSSKILTNTLYVYNTLSAISATQDIDLLTSIMKHASEQQVLEVIKGAFGTTLTGTAVDQAINLIKNHTGEANGFTDLYTKSPSEIATQAKGDKAILYALTKLNPFAIEGNLPAYTDIDPTHYSEKYLQDRAQYLYYLSDKTNRYDIDPTHTMNHFEDSGLGSDYTLEQSFSRSRILFGGEGYSTLNGGEYGDHLYGMGGADGLNGNGGDDWIEGGEGADILDGGAGKDILIGGYTKDKVDAQSDMLKGGTDFDTYISGNMDIINDSDGKGRVYFEGKLLSGGTKDAGQGCATQPDGSQVYKGDGGVYTLKGNTLTFVKDGKILTFENYTKNQLSLTFTENPADGESCSSSGSVGGEGGSGGSGSGSCPKPVDPSFNLNFSLPSVIQSVVNYITGGGTYYYGGSGGSGGGGGGSVSHSGGSVSSTPHTTPTTPAPKVDCPNNPLYSSAGTGGRKFYLSYRIRPKP